jgi:hypothetical protein
MSASLEEQAESWLLAAAELKAESKELAARRKEVKQLEQALSVRMAALKRETVVVNGETIVRSKGLRLAKDAEGGDE